MSVQSDCTGYPLAAGSVHGVRTFKVDGLGRLTGVTYESVWTPGENTATCRVSPGAMLVQQLYNNMSRGLDPWYSRGTVAAKSATGGPCKGDNPDCPCGFYAYHDGSNYPGGDVTGVIEGYGRTSVGTKGFRSQKARIVALYIPHESAPSSKERRSRTIAVIGLLGWVATLLANPGDGIRDWMWWLFVVLAGIPGGISINAARDWFLCRQRRLARPVNAWADKVRRNYPDVAYFTDRAAMLAAYPPDPQLEPTPETDPEFWSRSTT